MSLYTLLIKSKKKLKAQHYIADINELSSKHDLLPYPDILIIEETPEGIFLNRYTLNGTIAGDTWHKNVKAAKEQAMFEYGDCIDKWQSIPEEIDNPVLYIMDMLKKN